MSMPIDGFDWDDVRVFLATLRAGSLRQAASDLGVSRPTAARHLDALEKRLGLQLFERRPDGLHATAEAVELVAVSEEAERAMAAVSRAAQAVDSELRGPVRVTVPAIVAADLLMPDFIAFTQRWPQIELHLQGSYTVTSLAQREADVAIRFMPHGTAPDAELTGRKVATAYVAAYGSGDCWIGQKGGAFDQQWVRTTPFPDLPVRGSMPDGEMQRSACAGGLGLAWLPCFVAEPRLKRSSEPQPGFDIWVLVHPDFRRNPRLRVFRDHIVEAIRGYGPRLEGRG
jgi:DNA-binding transcriptional LysR family regulator